MPSWPELIVVLMTEPTPSAALPLRDQVIVITGASRGFGYALARLAGCAGAQIIAMARTSAGLEELDDDIRAGGGPGASLIPVDLRDQQALARLGPALQERHGKIDTLVHAAATSHGLSRLWDTSPGEFGSALYLSSAAAHQMIWALHPLLVRAPRPQAVFLTDATAPDPAANWAHYAAGKAALNTLVAAYAVEAAPAGVAVTAFDPGPMKTALRGRAFPGEDPANPAPPDRAARWLLEHVVIGETAKPGALNALSHQDLLDA